MSSPHHNHVPHILIAAARKSSGKTSFTLGLARTLTRAGMVVQTYKKGPDYIDPLWLEQASGRPCYNLDFNTMTSDEILTTFRENLGGADIALIETNKGLFDGLDVEGSDSNAALAKLLGSPVVLVLDTVGMTRGIAPLLQGYQNFDDEINIAGVVLNKTGGPRHESKLVAAIDHYNDLPVLGTLPRRDELAVDERHLGLTTPGDVSGATPVIEALADAVEQGVDLEKVIALGRTATVEPLAKPVISKQADVSLGIPRDAAFGFYYPDDLEALERAGAKLKFFSPLEDIELPPVDGVFIGGGFPETHLESLSQNSRLRTQIKTLIQVGLPTYAECGGLMYLCEQIVWENRRADMVGVIPGTATMNKRPQGRGFARLKATANAPWLHSEFAAHEFHYASLEGLPDNLNYAYEVIRGHGIDGTRDGIVINNMMANFCHLRDSKTNPWAENFVSFVRRIKNAGVAISCGAISL
ncbi:Protein similar to cobyrinic acid a,c-diamide synthetase clustered with dissimilatory sulfite reductase [hydrothermal vent metagenome]|uniref:Protein similar to cobyrinic acid a,c-diamide synthetase clustered with dissimilatory sulfite reductase n=1 Tax=hydrothermal vent metagenome TaxID=652676 RepID=A0A3B0S4Z9_9ZZZZ